MKTTANGHVVFWNPLLTGWTYHAACASLVQLDFWSTNTIDEDVEFHLITCERCSS